MYIWTAVLLLALPYLVAGTTYICKDNDLFLLKEGDCVQSNGYPGSYKKGDKCCIRISVNRRQNIRLEPQGTFKLRPNQQCQWDRFKYWNMANPNFNNKNPRGYYLGRLCKKDQMHGAPKALIMNTHQARMVFSAASKGSIKGKKWKFCLKPRPRGYDVIDGTCGAKLKNFKKGTNMRLLPLTNMDDTKVTKVCCQTSDLGSNDYATVACADSSRDKAGEVVLYSKGATQNVPKCTTCSSVRKEAEVAVDVSYKNKKKAITCSCSIETGIPINDACTSPEDPCLDSKDLAFCNGTTCVCPTDYVVSTNGSYCTKEVILGGDCSDGQNCVSTYDRAECDGTTCVCPSGYETDTTHCYKEVELGGDCSEAGSVCIEDNDRATCQSGTCACNEGKTNPHDTTMCILEHGLDESCVINEDCSKTERLECSANTCVCQSNYTNVHGDCSLNLNVGAPETCEHNYDCKPDNSKCDGGTCICKNLNYKANDGGSLCNRVCLLSDGSTQIEVSDWWCNKKTTGNKKCAICKCTDPDAIMASKQTKSGCGAINKNGKTCGKTATSSPIPKYTVNGGNACGDN